MQQWTVIGAGPVGIACVGTLLDRGIQPKQLTWVDPQFQVGDLGQFWQPVSSNTKVGLFTRFLEQCQSFKIKEAPHFALSDLEPDDTCLLRYAVEPLQWVSDHLCKTVNTRRHRVTALEREDGHWQVHLDSGETFDSEKVIVAIGSEPKAPLFETPETIDLVTALDPKKLARAVKTTDTVAVFGSSHSAVLILKSLVEIGVKSIINFYRNPLLYAVYYDDWILYDNTGLKGIAAQWAKANLEGKLPANLKRIQSTRENIDQWLPTADKAIYPIGFDTRELSVKGGPITHYNTQTGEIMPNLYGAGIAFPEIATDRVGNTETQVGLWKFMVYLQRNIPDWISTTH